MTYPRVWVAAAFLFLGGMGCGLVPGCFRSGSDVADEAVLVVNSKTLTAEIFAKRLEARLRNHDALYAKDPQSLKRTKEGILNEFIEGILIQDWAEANGVQISDEVVEQEVNRIRSSYPDDLTFRQALNDEKIVFEEWRKDVAASVLKRAATEKITALAEGPTDKELRAFYDKNLARFKVPARVRLRQVVLEKDDVARRLREEIRKGKSLERIAREYSVAPEAKNGGDTGWIEKGTLEVFDQAFNWRVGQLSEVVKSPYGFHIIQVLDKRGAEQLKFEQSRASILQTLRAEKERAAYLAWLEAQLKSAKILRNDSLVEGIKVVTKAQQ